MKRLISRAVLLFPIVSIHGAVLYGQGDPVKATLDEERKAFRTLVEKAKKDLSTMLQAKIEEARKSGDREGLLQASKEKVDLEVRGVLPKAVSTEVYREALGKALKDLDGAFDVAVKKYVQAGEDFKAEVLEDEKKALAKEFGADLPADEAPLPDQREKNAAKKKAKAQEPLDPWGRWDKFPGDKFGPRCIIWQDEKAWHLRVMTATRLRRFEGAIQVVGGKLTSLTGTNGLELEGKKKDVIQWNDDRDRISFNFLCQGEEDGFDFKLARSAIKLRCNIKLDTFDHPESIFIGSQGQHPPQATFTIELKPPPTQKKR